MTVLEEYKLHARLIEQEQQLKAMQMELESLQEIVKKNGELLAYAQTWVIMIIISWIGYLLFKGIREFYSRLQKVDTEKALRDEVDYLHNEVQVLMSLCIKQEEKDVKGNAFTKEEIDRDSIGMPLSPREQPEKKRRKRKGKLNKEM